MIILVFEKSKYWRKNIKDVKIENIKQHAENATKTMIYIHII